MVLFIRERLAARGKDTTMKTLFLATAALAALVLGAPIGTAHAGELSCPDAAVAVHDVIVGLPLLMDSINVDAKGRKQKAENQKWGNAAFHMARNGLGAVNYGLENCTGFEQFSDAQAEWKAAAANLKTLGFH
jgi:hypothetical protein